MKISKESEFNVGDRVYHKLPGSPIGIITDISYTAATRNFVYYVTYDPQQSEIQCHEWELTTEPNVI